MKVTEIKGSIVHNICKEEKVVKFGSYFGYNVKSRLKRD